MNELVKQFDDGLLKTVYKEWKKEIGPICVDNFGKLVAADVTQALIAKNINAGSVPDPVVEKMLLKGPDVAMRWWFAEVFVWLME